MQFVFFITFKLLAEQIIQLSECISYFYSWVD